MRGSAIVFAASLPLAGCNEPLRCTSASVVERVNVKLERELNENIWFPEPHEPKRSSFSVDHIEDGGTDDGKLKCTARFRAKLSASPSFAKAHGFAPPANVQTIERRVRFTAHAYRWDTYVEVVGLDAPLLAAPATAQAEGVPQ